MAVGIFGLKGTGAMGDPRVPDFASGGVNPGDVKHYRVLREFQALGIPKVEVEYELCSDHCKMIDMLPNPPFTVEFKSFLKELCHKVCHP